MKKFEIPSTYKSNIVSAIKEKRREDDKMKKDFSPTRLDFGKVEFLIARHFGFCYGVENAIEIIYKIIAENTEKRVFLLSEMIHNPKVNTDLQDLGIKFIMDTSGKLLVNWEEITEKDIVVIPAFGTTIEIENRLRDKKIQIEKYNTTCPFVERVWKRSEKLGKDNYAIIIHGKNNHEETRATFSHSKAHAPTLVIQDIEEAKLLTNYINGKEHIDTFHDVFSGRYSEDFDPTKHLHKLGVVNQTTMLATETQAIADLLKSVIINSSEVSDFADTRDTLCYATSDNQNAVYGMLSQKADFAIVVGGYNSSNTSHLVELCEEKIPTFHISGSDKLLPENAISHFNSTKKKEIITTPFLKPKEKTTVLITSGASCPDATVQEVLETLLIQFNIKAPLSSALKQL